MARRVDPRKNSSSDVSAFHQMKIQALATARRFFSHEREDAVRVHRGVDEKRDPHGGADGARRSADVSVLLIHPGGAISRVRDRLTA